MAPETKPERDQTMFREHVFGDVRIRTLADRFGLTFERVRQIVQREATEHINSLELNLMVARKEGAALGLIIPPGFDDDQQAATSYLQWVLKRLAARGVTVTYEYCPTHTGAMAFFITDVTNYDSGSAEATDERVGGIHGVLRRTEQ